MIILSCKDICKSYGIRDVLKDITFSINEGDKVGIIGANGEGKSTLFKIITKEISQDSGEIFIDKNKTLGYLLTIYPSLLWSLRTKMLTKDYTMGPCIVWVRY